MALDIKTTDSNSDQNLNNQNRESQQHIVPSSADPISTINMENNVPSIDLIQNHAYSNIETINLLLKRTGYPLVQENGQRKYGPPPNWNNRTIPDRGCEAFIGKIPRDCFEDELIPILEQIGPIYEFRLMMEYSGYNRGYGFVMYTCREDSKKCVIELNNYEIRKGRMIGVCRSVDNCRLFVGGIPKNKKREEILDEMKKVTEDVVNVIVYPSAHDKTKNRGFAFVQYSSHRAAAIARRKLIPKGIQLFGQPIAVDWAEPEPEVDEDIMATVKIVYVRNLMLNTTEDKIKIEFEKSIGEGSIERVKKMKDFAFVHFKERDDAISCIRKLNGCEIDGSVVELSLSKPADKANLQKLLRTVASSPTNAIDLNLILAQNIMPPNASLITFPLINNPAEASLQYPLINNDIISTENQANIQPVALPIQQNDLNQKVVSYQPNTPPYLTPNNLKYMNKVKNYSKNLASRYPHTGLQNGLVIGTVKKQPPNQDVPYEFLTNYNQIPVLAFNPNVHYFNKSPIQLLDEICKKEGLNAPIYTLHTTPGTDQEGREIGLYMYKISICNFLNGQPMCSSRLMRTIEEAKYDAAEFAISQIYSQYNHGQTTYMEHVNDQYLKQINQMQALASNNTMIPATPYIIPTHDYQVSPNDITASQNYLSDPSQSNQAIDNTSLVTSTATATSNESINSSISSSTVNPNQFLVAQPCQLPPHHPTAISSPPQHTQFVIDSTGQYILYPTQAYY